MQLSLSIYEVFCQYMSDIINTGSTTTLTAFQRYFYTAAMPINSNLWLRSMVIRQRTGRLKHTNGSNAMRTRAERCAPIIYIKPETGG